MDNSNFISVYKNKKVLVTGTTGFKGSWLSYWLSILGARVIGVGLKPENGSILFKSLKLHKIIKQHYLDISNFTELNKIIKKSKPDIIFHLAAQSIVSESYNEPLKTIKTNTLGSVNILEATRLNKIKSLVYITSDKCYLNVEKKSGYKESDILGGRDIYSSSKAAAEIIFSSYHHSFFKKKNLNHASARAGNVIGGGDMKKNRIIPDIIKAIQNDKKIYLRSPNSTRPWQHVLEPLFGYLKLGSLLMKNNLKNIINPSWNFGPYKKNCVKVKVISNMILNNFSISQKNIIIRKKKKFKEANLLSLNIKKAAKELNWKPKLSLKETVNLTTNWYKSYYQGLDMVKFTKSQIDYFLSKK